MNTTVHGTNPNPPPSPSVAETPSPPQGVGAVLFQIMQPHINRAEHFDRTNPAALALNDRFDDGVNDYESHVGRDRLIVWRSGYEWIDMETPADILAYVEDFYQGIEVTPRGFSLMPRYYQVEEHV